MSDHDASPGSSRCKGHSGIENRCDLLHHTSSRLDDAGGGRGGGRERAQRGGEREGERERERGGEGKKERETEKERITTVQFHFGTFNCQT